MMSQASARSGPPLPPTVFAGFAAAVAAVLLMAIASNEAQQRSSVAAYAVTQSMELNVQTQNLLSSVKDAETGQRDFCSPEMRVISSRL